MPSFLESIPLFRLLALASLALCGAACQSPREAAELDGGSRLDPTSPASRAKLNAAQSAYGSSSSAPIAGRGNDLGMRAFDVGRTDLAMPAFGTKGLPLKSFTRTPAFQTGSAPTGLNRNFAGASTPLQPKTSRFSGQASDAGNSIVAAPGYATKSFRGGSQRLRIPRFRSPDVTRAGSLVQSSPGEDGGGGASVGDIRRLLNR